MNTPLLFFFDHENNHRVLKGLLWISIFFLWPTSQKKLMSLPPISYQLPLNRASKEELLCLPSLGEKRVEEILLVREQKGSFTSLEELAEIKGIGPRLIYKLSSLVKIP